MKKQSLTKELFEKSKIFFSYKNYYINIFVRGDGDYEYSIYINESHYKAGGNPVDGGIIECMDPNDDVCAEYAIEDAIETANIILERFR